MVRRDYLFPLTSSASNTHCSLLQSIEDPLRGSVGTLRVVKKEEDLGSARGE